MSHDHWHGGCAVSHVTPIHSGAFFGVVSDDLSYVGVFPLLDKSCVVEALVIARDFVLSFRSLVHFLTSNIFRRDECGLLTFSRRLNFGGRRGAGTYTRTYLRRLERLIALGADHWRLMEVVKFGATMEADTLRTKFWLCHDFEVPWVPAPIPDVVSGAGTVNGRQIPKGLASRHGFDPRSSEAH
jgi:hypothetical protein